MVDEQTVLAKVLDQVLSHLVVSHYHELLNQLLTVDSLLHPYVDWVVLLVQLETYLVSVEDLSV